jgi:hypothetical protein
MLPLLWKHVGWDAGQINAVDSRHAGGPDKVTRLISSRPFAYIPIDNQCSLDNESPLA